MTQESVQKKRATKKKAELHESGERDTAIE